MQNFGILGQLLKIPPLSAQKCHSEWGSGGRQIFAVDWNPYGAHAQFRNPTTTPSKILVTVARE